MADAGIVRNRLKIAAAISNAQAYLAVVEGIRQLRPLHLAICAGSEQEKQPKRAGEICHADAGIGRDEQGSEAARLSFRRDNDLLCIHASGGHGQRSCAGMFSPGADSR